VIILGYLVCDKCQGYYELQSGESPKDFLDNCECGGTLNYSTSPDLEVNVPEKDYNQTTERHAQKTVDTNLEISKRDTRIIRLIIGILIVLIPNFLFTSPYNLILFSFYGIPLFLAGYVSSLFIDGKFSDGILNGARVGLFSGLIYLIISFIVFLIYGGTIPDLVVIVLSFIILIGFTSVGGFVGIAARNMLVYREKDEIVVEEIIEEPVKDTRDPAESKYHNEMVELGYKEVSAINSGEKIFKDLLSDSISEKDAIAQLKEDQTIAYEVLKEMQGITPPPRYKEYHQLKIEATKDICRTFEIIDGLVCNDPNKIEKTNNLVENSTNKINEAISELHKTLQEERMY
jgi:hypothetical protein